MFVQSRRLRAAALPLLALKSRLTHRDHGPRILVVSMPKSGTHLVTGLLHQIHGVSLGYSHLTLPQCYASREGGSGIAPRLDVIARELARLRGGQAASCHFPYDTELDTWLHENEVRVIFVARDPREVLISQVNYVLHLERHPLHEAIRSRLTTTEERLRFFLHGQDDLEEWRDPGAGPYLQNRMPSLCERAQDYSGWFTARSSLSLDFSELVGAQGGGEQSQRLAALERIANFVDKPLSERALQKVSAEAELAFSPTKFRGQTGTWAGSLSPELIREINEALRPLWADSGWARCVGDRSAADRARA